MSCLETALRQDKIEELRVGVGEGVGDIVGVCGV